MENGMALAVSDWAAGQHPLRSSDPGATDLTYHTAGTATICNPAHRPDLNKVQQTLPRGEPGHVREQIDLEALRARYS